MDNANDQIRDFFRLYEANANAADAEKTAMQFADIFMAADPNGARAVPASALLVALPQRKKLFEEIGASTTTLASFEQTRLDERYVLVRTAWLVVLDKENAGTKEIGLRSTFLIYLSENGPKIVFYLNHEDLASSLRAKGLLSSDET